MIKILTNAFLASSLAVLLYACNSNVDDPRTVTKHFFEAFKEMNTDEAAKYATRSSKTILDLVKVGLSFKEGIADSVKAQLSKHDFKYGEAVINGDDATVTVSVDGKEKSKISLKKEDGLWKVAFDFNAITSYGFEKMEQHGSSPEDLEAAKNALKNAHLDSLSKVLNEVRGQLDTLKN
jgi:hypothetical protein